MAGIRSKEEIEFEALGGQDGLDRLASYRVISTGSGTTTTELAFLGRVDGVFTELDLASAMALFLDEGELLAPQLRPLVDDDIPLFVGIDLTQWVLSGILFAPGDVFGFANGLSPALPGFLVGYSPISLGANGWTTASPASGLFVASDLVIDGRQVPEPTLLMLMTLGWALHHCVRRRVGGRHSGA